jgi:hypothetical protein
MRSLLVLLTMTSVAAAEARVVKSGPHRVALVELYTSEGCSSCPPADAWIRTLPGRGLGADKMVPLALHVDYWNDIGWIDPFSQPRFTNRQREAASRSGSGLYTPELVLNGRELRDRGSLEEKLRALADGKPRAELTVETVPLSADKLKATVRVNADAPRTRLYLAVYENDLTVAVRTGENAGRTLVHDFVVRELYGPLDGRELSRELTLRADWKRGKLGLATFVEDATTGEVLQAMAVPL